MSSSNNIEYSKRYSDDQFEYRHVILPKDIAKKLPDPPRLLTETEWHGLGVHQSDGWMHYEIHGPEPHILLFRRPLTISAANKTTDSKSSKTTAVVAKK
jgi:cyclin-dependent kinase regulatory subunit CKS1